MRRLLAHWAVLAAVGATGVGPRNDEAAADAAPRANAVPAHALGAREEVPDSWIGVDGRLRQLYRPQFVPAAELLQGARSILPSSVELTLDSMRHRLLLTGAALAVASGAEAIGYLDVPTPSADVEVTIVETARRCHGEHGGHALFNRDGPPAGPDTFFRSLRFDFEPESWLRSELVGEDPFQGTSIHGARSGTGGAFAGAVDLVLRSLAREGEAEILTSPSIVVTEGVPAVVQSTLELPATVFTRSDLIRTYGTINEHTGVRLEVLAQRVGADRVTLSLHPWVRQLTESRSPTGPAGAPVLSIREMSTTVTVPEGQSFVVGGLEGWSRVGDRTGLPVPAALIALTSALGAAPGATLNDIASVDLVFCVRVRIRHPGRDDARIVPPCEGARRARNETAGRVPAPRPR